MTPVASAPWWVLGSRWWTSSYVLTAPTRKDTRLTGFFRTIFTKARRGEVLTTDELALCADLLWLSEPQRNSCDGDLPHWMWTAFSECSVEIAPKEQSSLTVACAACRVGDGPHRCLSKTLGQLRVRRRAFLRYVLVCGFAISVYSR